MARDDPEEGMLGKHGKNFQQLTPLNSNEEGGDYRISWGLININIHLISRCWGKNS